jgi:hypothetical protein
LNPDQANAEGVSNDIARKDHIHNVPADTAVSLDANSTNTEGASSSFARADHTHDLSTGVPSTQSPDQANAEGTSANLARADHIHNIPADVAVDVGSTNTEGVSTSFSRADHVHRGVRSIKENVGTQRFGDVSLIDGTGINITDGGSGNFTISSSNGPSRYCLSCGYDGNAPTNRWLEYISNNPSDQTPFVAPETSSVKALSLAAAAAATCTITLYKNASPLTTISLVASQTAQVSGLNFALAPGDTLSAQVTSGSCLKPLFNTFIQVG